MTDIHLYQGKIEELYDSYKYKKSLKKDDFANIQEYNQVLLCIKCKSSAFVNDELFCAIHPTQKPLPCPDFSE